VEQNPAKSGNSRNARFGPHVPQRRCHYRQDFVPHRAGRVFEEISPVTLLQDVPQLIAISERYGRLLPGLLLYVRLFLCLFLRRKRKKRLPHKRRFGVGPTALCAV
jgi:hypothetical protein